MSNSNNRTRQALDRFEAKRTRRIVRKAKKQAWVDRRNADTNALERLRKATAPAITVVAETKTISVGIFATIFNVIKKIVGKVFGRAA